MLSSGDHRFSDLKYWGPHSVNADGDTVYYKVKDFEFQNEEGETVTLDDFKDKIIIALVLSPECPENCAVQMEQFKLMIHDEIKSSNRYDDIVILAHIVDYFSDEIPTEYTRLKDYIRPKEANWELVTGPTNPLYDFKPRPEAKNLLRDEHPEIMGRKGYHQFALLIDKDQHVRGVYDMSKSPNIRTLNQEMRILKKLEKLED